jgi:hypothetical protein
LPPNSILANFAETQTFKHNLFPQGRQYTQAAKPKYPKAIFAKKYIQLPKSEPQVPRPKTQKTSLFSKKVSLSFQEGVSLFVSTQIRRPLPPFSTDPKKKTTHNKKAQQPFLVFSRDKTRL